MYLCAGENIGARGGPVTGKFTGIVTLAVAKRMTIWPRLPYSPAPEGLPDAHSHSA